MYTACEWGRARTCVRLGVRLQVMFEKSIVPATKIDEKGLDFVVHPIDHLLRHYNVSERAITTLFEQSKYIIQCVKKLYGLRHFNRPFMLFADAEVSA